MAQRANIGSRIISLKSPVLEAGYEGIITDEVVPGQEFSAIWHTKDGEKIKAFRSTVLLEFIKPKDQATKTPPKAPEAPKQLNATVFEGEGIKLTISINLSVKHSETDIINLFNNLRDSIVKLNK